MRTMHLNEFVPRDGLFHVARARYVPGQTMHPHRQNFPEVFWVERGRGQHQINHQRQSLEPGDVVFVRASDVHGFRSRTGSTLVFVNLAFSQNTLKQLRQRYAADTAWPWHDERMPEVWRLAQTDISLLGDLADRLSMHAQRRLDFEHLLLTLLCMRADHHVPSVRPLPEWLTDALSRADRQPNQADTAQFATWANRSPEHVNRVVRECFGTTTTQLLNNKRLDTAARLLRMTHRPIIDIAADCGYPNLGYFYKRFTERFEQTPRKYRLAGQAIVR